MKKAIWVWITVWLLFLFFVWGNMGIETQSTVVYLAIIGVGSLILYDLLIRPVDPSFTPKFFWAALGAKLFGSFARYMILWKLYHGVGDAVGYHGKGKFVAQFFKRGDFSLMAEYPPLGTYAMIHLSGLIYSVLPPSMLGMFFWCAFFAFAGSVFYYRAYLAAFPDGNRIRFRWIVFFLPSILFWPSSLGKDAVVYAGLGLAFWGLASFYRQGKIMGLLGTATGLIVAGVIRPHVALFVLVAGAVTYGVGLLFFVRKRPMVWWAGIMIFAFLATIVTRMAIPYFERAGLSDFSIEEIRSFYEFRQQATLQGGSKAIPPVVFSLAGPIAAIPYVLFRPLLFEARSLQMAVASIESLVWLVLFFRWRQTFMDRMRRIFTDPFTLHLVVFVWIMMMAHTIAGNLGIIARQRTVFLPLIWMLFS